MCVSTAVTPTYDGPHWVTSSFIEFTAATTDEVVKLISCARNKTCRRLDRAPTWLVKDVSGLPSHLIASLSTHALLPSRVQRSLHTAILEKRWSQPQ